MPRGSWRSESRIRPAQAYITQAMKTFLSLLGIVFPVLVAAQPKPAPVRTPADAALEALAAVRHIPEVALSPDGHRVAWLEQVPQATGRPATHLLIRDLGAAGGPRTIAVGSGSGPVTLRRMAWSPDGRLALLSNAGMPGQSQIFVVDAALGSARKLTSVKGELGTLRWSPDGRSIAFLFIENAHAEAGPLVAKPTETGVIGDEMDVQRLAIADPTTGQVRSVSPADLYVHEFDWAPDGKHWVATASPPPGDSGWYDAKLYAIDAGSGEARLLFTPTEQIGCPRFAPDGKSIAFIAGLMSDEGPVGGDVLVVPATGGTPRNLTPDLPLTPSSVAWSSSAELVIGEYAEGGSGFASIDLPSGRIASLWRGDERVSGPHGTPSPGFSLAADGKTTAVVRQSFEQPPEVWTGAIGAWTQASRANAGRTRLWGEVKNLTWKSDGRDVQGFLLAPREIVAGKRYPLVVDVHGGPASSWIPSWPEGGRSSACLMASDGFFVFLPNPRGSHGRGEAFTRGNVKDFGGGDLRDILSGLDEVLKTAPVDPARIGITGGSYGGFMSMFAVTQTRRFRAAVAVAGIANWQSYYGQNGISRWMPFYFGATVYDDPAVYAKSSAINFIKNAKTPTLVIVGEGDVECPPPQSYEFWRALKTLGVKTELVVYAKEGHHFEKNENVRDALRRTWDWFRQELGTAAP
jgi:dipeptidyl aminopeptidase/acylaminoacyl peptidase